MRHYWDDHPLARPNEIFNVSVVKDTIGVKIHGPGYGAVEKLMDFHG
jgi:hypothetical protein